MRRFLLHATLLVISIGAGVACAKPDPDAAADSVTPHIHDELLGGRTPWTHLDVRDGSVGDFAIPASGTFRRQ